MTRFRHRRPDICKIFLQRTAHPSRWIWAKILNKPGKHCQFQEWLTVASLPQPIFKWKQIRGSWRGDPIPIFQPKFWLNPIVPLQKSRRRNACLAQNLSPIFYWFFVDESQSQCMKSHFPSKKMSKSQFPLYPFRTLKLVCLLHLTICIKISQFCWPCSAVLGKYNAEKRNLILGVQIFYFLKFAQKSFLLGKEES